MGLVGRRAGGGGRKFFCLVFSCFLVLFLGVLIDSGE